MKVLWICRLPQVVQKEVFAGEDHGAETALSWIVAHLPPPEEVELHFGCLWPGGEKRKTVEYKRARFHLLPCPSRGRALLLFQRDTSYFQQLFHELKPDLVHGWGTEDSYGLVARRLAPKRHVIGIQGLIWAYYKHLPKSYRTFVARATESITLRRARYVVAETQYSLDGASPLCPSAAKRIVEHPLRSEFLESEPCDNTSKTVLFVGEITERKGIFDAISAFAQVAPEDWNLHLVGTGTPEDERRMYALLKDGRTRSRVRHSSRFDANGLVKAMRNSSVFLLPTRVDTGPTALKEALTMGLWPVCYDNSGPGEYLRKYGFGSLATDQDMNSLCSELKRCLVEKPWQRAEKRTVLARRTRQDFSREKAWEKLTELYRSVTSTGRPARDDSSTDSSAFNQNRQT
jgi:glycosyltransferase involved in cell wall biosynthesis